MGGDFITNYLGWPGEGIKFALLLSHDNSVVLYFLFKLNLYVVFANGHNNECDSFTNTRAEKIKFKLRSYTWKCCQHK